MRPALVGPGAAGWTLRSVGGIVATSRIHVQIHHASDVAGGIVVGALLGTAIRRLRPLP